MRSITCFKTGPAPLPGAQMGFVAGARRCALLAVALCSLMWLPAAEAKSEDELLADLTSPDVATVRSAVSGLESGFARSGKAQVAIRQLLKDSRSEVRRKAARSLGNMHAAMDAASLKDLCAMLSAPAEHEVMDALKGLRGLDVPQAVPEILPALRHPSAVVVRDACRTLAALGNPDAIPALSVLQQNAEPEVIDEARAAIKKLRAKAPQPAKR